MRREAAFAALPFASSSSIGDFVIFTPFCIVASPLLLREKGVAYVKETPPLFNSPSNLSSGKDNSFEKDEALYNIPLTITPLPPK